MMLVLTHPLACCWSTAKPFLLQLTSSTLSALPTALADEHCVATQLMLTLAAAHCLPPACRPHHPTLLLSCT
jgi:hypothetical protein